MPELNSPRDSIRDKVRTDFPIAAGITGPVTLREYQHIIKAGF